MGRDVELNTFKRCSNCTLDACTNGHNQICVYDKFREDLEDYQEIEYLKQRLDDLKQENG